MKVRIFDTSEQAGIYAASLVERVILEQNTPVLGLATGSTVIPLYQSLVRFAKSGLDMSRVLTFNLDEYIGIPLMHEHSYHYFMRQNLFSHVNIPKHQIHIPNGCAVDLTAECARYDAQMALHPIDLQILGIGVNGHIGFNEPDDLLMSRTHVVRLSDETISSNARFFTDISEVPRQAITMGVQSILQARKIVLMAFGDEKADIVAKAIQGPVRTDVPASMLQLHRDVTVVVDTKAARDLTSIG